MVSFYYIVSVVHRYHVFSCTCAFCFAACTCGRCCHARDADIPQGGTWYHFWAPVVNAYEMSSVHSILLSAAQVVTGISLYPLIYIHYCWQWAVTYVLYIYEHKLSKCYTKRGMSGFKQILEKEHKNVYDHFILKSFKPHGIVVDNKLLNKCPFR